MLLYEVNLAVEADAAPAYAAWLEGHMPAVLACDGFLSAEWFDVDPDDTPAPGSSPGQALRVRWCVQYRVRDRAALDAYFAGPAARLRADGLQRFGGRFEATRRVLVPRGTSGVRPTEG